MSLKVIMDSNFLMIPSQFRLDIFGELQRALNRSVKVIILSSVYEELRKISSEGNSKGRRQAEMALKLIEKFEIVDIRPNPNETVDNCIIRLAKEWNCPVATNDGRLRRKLRDIKVPVIYLRQRVRLEVEGVIS